MDWGDRSDVVDNLDCDTINGVYTNGLNAFASLHATDKKTGLSDGWRPGEHSDWNKWEYNPNTAGDFAPERHVYLYNSFEMNDPASSQLLGP